MLLLPVVHALICVRYRQNIEDPDEGERELHAKEDRIHLEETLLAVRAAVTIELPALKLAPEASAPYETTFAHSRFDTSQLVVLRQAHETERAKKGVRTSQGTRQWQVWSETAQESSEPSIQPQAKEASRRAIMREMAAILRGQQDNIGTTTGLNCNARIQDQASKAAGNSANAELAAGQKAAAVCLDNECQQSRLLTCAAPISWFGDATRPFVTIRLVMLYASVML